MNQANTAPGLFPPNPASNIKRVIAVVSGKGGVGKSSVTALLASQLHRLGNRVGVLDGDITGPSIPKMFGVTGAPEATAKGLVPRESQGGIKLISMNLLLGDEEAPVIWRAPLLSQAISQFWTNTVWGDLDWLLVDLPPGTADVPLTVMQSLPLSGVVIVTSPQSLVLMVVKKAVHMAETMKVPILGVVENLSFVQCPGCKEEIHPFGEGKTAQLATDLGVPLLATLPIDPEISRLADLGRIEDYRSPLVEEMAKELLNL